MKSLIKNITKLFIVAFMALYIGTCYNLISSADAQAVSQNYISYQLPVQQYLATSTPAAGTNVSGSGAIFHQVTWAIIGGTVLGCSLTIDSSTNNVTWSTGGIVTTQTCTSNGTATSTALVASYIRINLSTYTVATGTPTLVVLLTGYSVNPGTTISGLVNSGMVNVLAYAASGDLSQATYAAGLANNAATLLVPVSGPTNLASVNPFSGSTDSVGMVGVPAFYGNIILVPQGNGNAKIQYSTAWTMFNRENSSKPGQILDLNGVELDPDTTATTGFYATHNGANCVTNGSANTSGGQLTCNNGGASISIVLGTGGTLGCAAITVPALAINHQLYGGEWLNMMFAADPRNNFAGRVVPSGDSSCAGTSPALTNSNTTETFYVQAPSMIACSGATGCGANMVIAWESETFNLGPRPWDSPDGTHICQQITGNPVGGQTPACQRYGNKIIRAGIVVNVGYGGVIFRTNGCQEQCNINNSQGSRATYYGSMLVYSSRGNGSQNNNAIQDFEDYCNSPNPKDTTGCINTGIHVGVAIRDSWFHGTIQNVTFNANNAYADIMFDGMSSFSAASSVKGIHTQDQGSDASQNSVQYYGGGLGNFVLGAQATAATLLSEQTESNANSYVLCNYCIMGSNIVPVIPLPNWQAGGGSVYYAANACILPTTNNAGAFVFCISNSGTNGASQPASWPQTPGVAAGSQIDGGVTWINVGTSLPNSSVPATAGGGGNIVILHAISNQSSYNPTVYNSNTNHSFNRNSYAEYKYQNDGGSITECATSSEFPCETDQGLAVGTNFTVTSAGLTTINSSLNVTGIFPITSQFANNATQPVVGRLAKCIPVANVCQATETVITDTQNALGVCFSGCNATGNSQIAIAGFASCIFDAGGVNAVGDFVTISNSIAGDCHDSGLTYPVNSQVLGIVSNVSLTVVYLFGPGAQQGGAAVILHKAEVGGDASLLSFTPPAQSGVYLVTFSLSVSAATAATIGWTATWRDTNHNNQAPANLSMYQTGVALPALTFAGVGGAANYYGSTIVDIDNAGTAIVVILTDTAGSITAKASAQIARIAP